MDKSARKITPLQILLVLFISACICCVLPFSRSLIISVMEGAIGRTLKEPAKWNAVISGAMSFFATTAAFLYFLLYIPKGRQVFSYSLGRTKGIFFSRKAALQIAVLFGIYLLCYFTLFRANYSFQDDIRRATTGHKSWVGSSRFVSETLAVFLHTNFYINDIAPLTQILALAVTSVASYTIASVLTNGAPTKVSLLASSLAGLCPFYFENMSYKFDSPYMAMAMLFGAIPFLFREDTASYIASSLMGLVLACSSYQAANSVYIMLSLCIAMKMLISRDTKKALRFLGVSAACYCAALIFFKIFIMVPTEITIDERNTNVALGLGLLETVKNNFIDYVRAVFSRFGNIWIRLFAAAAAILFPFAAARESEGRLRGAAVAAVSLAAMFCLSFGAYLAIGNTVTADRAFMGFDALLAIVAVTDSALCGKNSRTAARIPAFAAVLGLFYGCAVHSVVRGNLYSKQLDYQKFRISILLGDLAHFVKPGEKNRAHICGNIGPAAHSYMEFKNYGLDIGGYATPWNPVLLQNWNMDIDFTECSEESLRRDERLKEELESMPRLVDSYYHDIYGGNGRFFIRLKNPQVKEYEIK